MHDDIHAVGVGLKLTTEAGPYAFNCGAPAFRFTEDRLRNDWNLRLVAMVRTRSGLGRRNAAIKKKEQNKKLKAEENCTCGRGIR